MKRWTRQLLTLGIPVLAWACGSNEAQPFFATLELDADALREAFEADAGKVRALFLASPT